MSTKYLPTSVVSTALPQIRKAISAGDPTALEVIKQWGFESIARVYDPDPIFRPHHYVMMWRANTEWRRMLEAHDRRLKEILLQKSEESWKVELGERILDQQHEGAKVRRRDDEEWNKNLRVGEFIETRSFETDEQIRLAEALARIHGQQAAPAAPPPDPWDEVRRIQAEMTRIAQDQTMSSAEKHRQTVPLQQALAQALANIGK